MSSAILYLAIIAIWLCVLIPRWLKRDSARGAVVEASTAGRRRDPGDRGAPTPTRPNSRMTAPRPRPNPASARAPGRRRRPRR